MVIRVLTVIITAAQVRTASISTDLRVTPLLTCLRQTKAEGVAGVRTLLYGRSTTAAVAFITPITGVTWAVVEVLFEAV